MSSQIEGFVKGVILGGLIGAALGILYAPQSGRKTRRDISRNAEDLLETAKEEYEAALKKSGRAYDSAVRQLKQLEAAAKDKVGEIEEKVVNAAVHAFK